MLENTANRKFYFLKCSYSNFRPPSKNHFPNDFAQTILKIVFRERFPVNTGKKPQTPHEWSFRRRKTCGEKFFQIEIPRLIAFVSVEGREIRCIVLNDNEPSSTDGEETRFHFDRIGSPLLSPIFRQMILHAIRSFPLCLFSKKQGATLRRLFRFHFSNLEISKFFRSENLLEDDSAL